MGVYEYVAREAAEADSDGKIVGVKWVKTNKGTAEQPEIRCRLVAQEFASSEYRDDLIAGTPPLAAMRMLLSEAASRGEESRKTKLMVVDVEKAFLYGRMHWTVYIEPPPEDPKAEGGEICGKAKKGDVRHERCTSRVAEGGVKSHEGAELCAEQYHTVSVPESFS